MNKYWICPVCTKRAGSGTFVCTGCEPNKWVHLKCGSYTRNQLKSLDKLALRCNNCKQNESTSVDADEEVNRSMEFSIVEKTDAYLPPVISSSDSNLVRIDESFETEQQSSPPLPDCFKMHSSVIDENVVKGSVLNDPPSSPTTAKPYIDFEVVVENLVEDEIPHASSPEIIQKGGSHVTDETSVEEKDDGDVKCKGLKRLQPFDDDSDEDVVMKAPLEAIEPRYRLQWKGKTAMVGKFVSDSREDLVHGHLLQKGHAKYEITTLYINNKWPQFQPDLHTPGTFISWPKKFAKKIMRRIKKTEEADVTEEARVEGEKKMLVCNCVHSNCNQLSETDLKDINHKYWASNYQERRTWLLKNIQEVSIKKRRKTTSNGNDVRRNVTREYYLNSTLVCKKKFMMTLGYNNDKFIIAAMKGPVADNIRGHHDHSYHSITETDDAIMEAHINSFEPGISHYRRSHAPHVLYVDPDLTISDMYDNYKEKAQKQDQNVLSLSSYTRKIHKMKISFAKLGHEECELCIKYEQHPCLKFTIKNLCTCCKAKGKCACCKEFSSAIKKISKKTKKYSTCEDCLCCNEHKDIIHLIEGIQEECDGCITFKTHIQNKTLARSKYSDDRTKAEDPEVTNTTYVSLDLQKVRMLPELEGVKTAVFTQRIAVYNESFSPLGRSSSPSIGLLWHQGVMGRNDEDITSCFQQFLKTCDSSHVVIWLDNCTAQNKNWTLYPALVAVVNDPKLKNLQKVTLKYFEPGHTYMSADSFHHRVENQVKKVGNLYDFRDFVNCVDRAGKAFIMKPSNFKAWKNELSQGKSSKVTRPLLDNVFVAEFRRGSYDLHFKTSHDGDFKSSDFLKKNFKIEIEEEKCNPPQSKSEGIAQKRKEGIIDNLLPLMPDYVHSFWKNIKSYKD